MRSHLIPLMLLAAGCGGNPLSPTERVLFEGAVTRWEQRGGPDYTVESRVLCFCPPYLTTWTRLTVRNDLLVSAEPLGPIFGGEEGSLTGWRTVLGAFEAIREVLYSDDAEDVTFSFDEELGYPLDFQMTCHPLITDCGFTLQMRNLVLLP